MFRAIQIKSICLIIITSVLLVGMCPTGMVADSFFASRHSQASVQDATRTTLRSTPSVATRSVAYTQETMPEQETVLTPTTALRRIHIRQGNRNHFSLHGILNISSSHANISGNHTGLLLIEHFSSMVIVNYIHHQDGAKA